MQDTNKLILRRHFDEVLNQGKLDVVDEIYTYTYVLDAPVQTEGSVASHGETHGRDGLKRRVILFRTAFPDIHFAVDNMITEGDQVAVQYTFTGTHTGKFGELEPTGKHISVTGILIALLRDDKIENANSVFDSGDMLHQLETEHKSPMHHLIDNLAGRVQTLTENIKKTNSSHAAVS